MKKALRYLYMVYLKPVIGAGAVITALTLAGAQLLHMDIFATYYNMLPMFFVMFALVFGFTIPTVYRNQAMAFGCRRRDYFLGSQATFLIIAVADAGLLALAGWLPSLLPGGYAPYALGGGTFLNVAPAWFSPMGIGGLTLLVLALQPIGVATGGGFIAHKIVGVIALVVSLLLGVAGTTLSLFVMDGTLTLPDGAVYIALGVTAALAVLGEISFYRSNRKAVVRS